MKRPVVLMPIVALIAVIAIVAVALASGGNDDNNPTAASGSSGGGSSVASTGGGDGGGAYNYGAPAKPAAKPAAGAGAATITIADHGLGKMLVDAQGRTLYLWQADTGMSSTCSGACALGWPPVTTSGTPKAAGGVQAGRLGTTKRADGTTQVTYGGHPLYRFAGDSAAGQVNGQANNGFGAPWYVVSATGTAITKAAS
jgi:predicted lipoprotein with Yx(FWY)xxD motif